MQGSIKAAYKEENWIKIIVEDRNTGETWCVAGKRLYRGKIVKNYSKQKANRNDFSVWDLAGRYAARPWGTPPRAFLFN
jgi:hypothetical protein